MACAKFVVSWWPAAQSQQYKISIEFKLQAKIIGEMGLFYTMLFVPIFQQPGRIMN